jgi:hypothetical protein
VRTTEQIAKSASTPKTGFFATLRGLPAAKGTGAPRTARRLLPALLTTLLASLAFAAAPAFAVAPTVISESASGVKAGEARVEAVVNPQSEPTECHFQYGSSSAGEHEVSCAAPLIEGGEQTVGVTLTGLTGHTVYHYRVVLRNLAAEEATGSEETFTTSFAPAAEANAPTKLTSTSALLQGVLNPAGTGEAGHFHFVFLRSPSVCEGAGEQQTETQPVTGAQGQPAEAPAAPGEHPAEQLLPDTSYPYCLIAENETGDRVVSAPVSFRTPPQAYATEVFTSTAKLHAVVNPEGVSSSYALEYALAGEPLEPVPGGSGGAGEGSEPVSFEAQLEGLKPGKAYRYRLTVTNTASETFHSEEHTFTTPEVPTPPATGSCPNEQRRAEQPFAQALPDCRAYEIVSPLNSEGQDATEERLVSGTARAAVSGEALTYVSAGSFAEPAGAAIHSQMLSRRQEAAGGWSTRSIEPPTEAYYGTLFGGYQGAFFTPELTAGLVSSQAVLAPGAPAGLHELYSADFASGSYTFLSKLPASEELYDHPYHTESQSGVFPLGASEDLSHVVFLATPGSGQGRLHEWVDGRVFIVNVSNSEPPQVLEGGVGHPGEGGIEADVWRAVSSDGSRVVFTHNGQLFMRINDEQPQSPMEGPTCKQPADACTIQISPGTAGAHYWGASTDDTKIFYTEGAEGGDLYEYTLPAGSVEGEAKALTTNGKLQGVVQVSEDGSYVYFIADRALAGNAVEGQPNLYVSHEAGVPTLIATLSPNDMPVWHVGPGFDESAIAPDGTRLAFTSEQNLTAYDNQQAGHGDCETEFGRFGETEHGRCREVYLYDAHAGTLVCASCDTTGARPVGGAKLTSSVYAAGGEGTTGENNYEPRDLLAGGSLFFESSDALVPHAGNGRRNVYEYENGQLHALSNVAGKNSSFFVDASPSGQDVFFATADQLLPQDQSNNILVYDARTGGGFAAPATTTSCQNGDSCKPPVSPQPAVTTPRGTATFNGLGNYAAPPPAPPKHKTVAQERAEKLTTALKTCRKKHNKHKRQVCEKHAHKAYGANASTKRSAKRASSDRRAHR